MVSIEAIFSLLLLLASDMAISKGGALSIPDSLAVTVAK
jgi:hypothetical protein